MMIFVKIFLLKIFSLNSEIYIYMWEGKKLRERERKMERDNEIEG